MRSGGAALFFGLAAAACVPMRALELPELPEDRGALLFYDHQILAFTGETEGALNVSDAAHLELVLLEHSFEELLIDEGRLAVIEEGMSRPLPRAAIVWAGEVGESNAVRWTSKSELSPAFASLRIAPAFDFERCAASERCIRDGDDEVLRTCVPCEAYAGPDAPEPPNTIGAGFPLGWREEQTPFARCVPPELPPLITCPIGQTQRYGDAVCTLIGGSCSENLPSTGVIRVSPGQSIRAAIQTGTTATIALSKGVYEESLYFLPGPRVTIRGACAAETIIDVGSDEIGAGGNNALDLAGVHIRGGVYGASVIDGGELTLRDVQISESIATGVHAANAAALKIFDARVEGGLNTCVLTSGVRSIEIADSWFDRCPSAGLRMHGISSTATITRSIFSDSTPTNNDYGVGIIVVDASVTLREVLIERAHLNAFQATFQPSLVRLYSVTARDTFRIEQPGETAALWLSNRRSVVDGLHVKNSVGSGIYLPAPTHAELRHVVIEDVERVAGWGDGVGLAAMNHALLDVRGLEIRNMHRYGVIVYYGSGGRFEDVWISDVDAPESLAGAAFAATESDHSLSLLRARIEDSGGDGVLLHMTSTATSVAIARCANRGLDVQAVSINLSRISIDDAGTRAAVFNGSFGEVSDLAITGKTGPVGLVFDDYAVLELRDFAIHGVPGAGILAQTSGLGGCGACVTLERGLVESNLVGAQIENPRFVLWKLMNNVRYRANEDTFRLLE